MLVHTTVEGSRGRSKLDFGAVKPHLFMACGREMPSKVAIGLFVIFRSSHSHV